jgi:hypothetical protein
MTRKMTSHLKASVALMALVAQLAALAGPAVAFCGVYVAKADSKLFNKSSKVVLSRDGRDHRHHHGQRLRLDRLLRLRWLTARRPTPSHLTLPGKNACQPSTTASSLCSTAN